jgi:hypothetical protein
MIRRFPIFALPIVFLCLLFLAGAGCWNPFAPTKDDDGGGVIVKELLQRTSPENVLFNLRLIYGDKDNLINSAEDAHYWAEEYRKLLHPDFIFFFVDGDQPDPNADPWWSKDDEGISFENMLLAIAGQGYGELGVLDEVQLTWTYGPSVPSDLLDHPDWRKIDVFGILLDVIPTDPTINPVHVPSGTAIFYFAPDPADTTLWVIAEWQDRPLE